MSSSQHGNREGSAGEHGHRGEAGRFPIQRGHDGRGRAEKWLSAIGRDAWTRMFVGEHQTPRSALAAYITLLRVDNEEFKFLKVPTFKFFLRIPRLRVGKEGNT